MADTEADILGETSPESTCDCEKCRCETCSATKEDDCACCNHGCHCCGENAMPCNCEDDCGCEPEDCNCGHGPCVSDTGACACGCGGHGDVHVCPVCGMKVEEGTDCACVCHHRASFICSPFSHSLSHSIPSGVRVAIGIAATADLALKVVALRRALKRGDKGWVVPLAVLNSLGVLPAIYLSTHPRANPHHESK